MCHTDKDAQQLSHICKETVKYYISIQFLVSTAKEHTHYPQLMNDWWDLEKNTISRMLDILKIPLLAVSCETLTFLVLVFILSAIWHCYLQIALASFEVTMAQSNKFEFKIASAKTRNRCKIKNWSSIIWSCTP